VTCGTAAKALARATNSLGVRVLPGSLINASAAFKGSADAVAAHTANRNAVEEEPALTPAFVLTAVEVRDGHALANRFDPCLVGPVLREMKREAGTPLLTRRLTGACRHSSNALDAELSARTNANHHHAPCLPAVAQMRQPELARLTRKLTPIERGVELAATGAIELGARAAIVLNHRNDEQICFGVFRWGGGQAELRDCVRGLHLQPKCTTRSR
jgi:hypothetical protein